MTIDVSNNGLTLVMQRGPYQNNGASPWYTELAVGTPAQPLKMALDTGTNITWATSTLCATDRCQHYSSARFDYAHSSTFRFTDCLQRPYSFGPWGTMQVESGRDVLTVGETSLQTRLLLAADYGGSQFEQLDWDGGIGLPSSSAYTEGRSSFLFQELMNAGKVDPGLPFISFDWDGEAGTGTCQMGAVDANKTKGPHLFLPWTVYSTLPGVEYIWSAALQSFEVGGEIIATDLCFALDSGSSQFKGDDRLMNETLKRIARGDQPTVVLGFADGEITLGADIYDVLIEEGPGKGTTPPQFQPLGLTDLVLVGSLVMERCYTVYEYQVVECRPGTYSLAPIGVWLFNRPDGPQIITRSSSKAFDVAPRSVTPGKVRAASPQPGSVAGTWKNDYGSMMTLNVEGHRVQGTYQSSTGSTGKYRVTGFQADAAVEAGHGLPVSFSIEWHSVGEGAPDPSWNWSSGLCGQVLADAQGDRLVVQHLLVATSDFPNLAEKGTYVDKLVYRRVAHAATPAMDPVADVATETNDALSGIWRSIEGMELTLRVYPDENHAYGAVEGELTSDLGTFGVSGFTDINARADGLAVQSLSLSAAGKAAWSLSGAVDLGQDRLDVQIMSATSTTTASNYVQTRIEPMTFSRYIESNEILR